VIVARSKETLDQMVLAARYGKHAYTEMALLADNAWFVPDGTPMRLTASCTDVCVGSIEAGQSAGQTAWVPRAYVQLSPPAALNVTAQKAIPKKTMGEKAVLMRVRPMKGLSYAVGVTDWDKFLEMVDENKTGDAAAPVRAALEIGVAVKVPGGTLLSVPGGCHEFECEGVVKGGEFGGQKLWLQKKSLVGVAR
jgi:hypothetical protein